MSKVIVLASMLFVLCDAHAIVMCKVGKKAIDPSYGPDMEHFTGVLTCREEDGKLQREESYVRGKKIGRQVMIDFQGFRVESTLNAQENKDGREMKYHPNGKLAESTIYKNGNKEGEQLRYSESGRLTSRAWYKDDNETSRIDYNQAGKLSELSCGDSEDFPEQAKLCGFRGVSVVQLYDGKSQVKETIQYLKGQAMDATSQDAQGRTYREVKLKDGAVNIEIINKDKITVANFRVAPTDASNLAFDGVAKSFFDDGKLQSEVTWVKGKQTEEKVYYQNGKMDEHSVLDPKTMKITSEYFDDRGQKTYESLGSFEYYPTKIEGYIGAWFFHTETSKENVFKNGKLVEERFYKNNALSNRKVYAEDGKVESIDYLPDGSTKL